MAVIARIYCNDTDLSLCYKKLRAQVSKSLTIIGGNSWPMPGYTLTCKDRECCCRAVMKVSDAVHGTRISSLPDKTRMCLRFRDVGISFVCRNIVPGSSRSKTCRKEGGR